MTDSILAWRKSTYSSQSGSCVELAPTADRRVLVRNSNHPDAGTIALTPAELGSWLAGCRAGDLD